MACRELDQQAEITLFVSNWLISSMQSAKSLGQTLVSIIVPTYNYGNLISETLTSIQSQTYENWECIVVDDGSTDNTAEVVACYSAKDSRIRYIQQENRRQAAARNNGIGHSRGEYFQFLDADDLLEREKLQRQVAFLDASPDVDIIYSNVRYFNDGNPSERRLANVNDQAWMPLSTGAGQEILLQIVRNNIMPVNAPLIRRSTIEQVGSFDERLPPVEDWEYLIRCAAADKRFHYADEDGIRALVRTHPESSSSDPRRMLRAEILMRETIRALLTNEVVIRLNEERLAEITGLLGVEEHTKGDRSRAASQFLKASAMDKRPRCRAKWLLCAAAAPFVTRGQMRKLVAGSISQSLADAVQ